MISDNDFPFEVNLMDGRNLQENKCFTTHYQEWEKNTYYAINFESCYELSVGSTRHSNGSII